MWILLVLGIRRGSLYPDALVHTPHTGTRAHTHRHRHGCVVEEEPNNSPSMLTLVLFLCYVLSVHLRSSSFVLVPYSDSKYFADAHRIVCMHRESESEREKERERQSWRAQLSIAHRQASEARATSNIIKLWLRRGCQYQEFGLFIIFSDFIFVSLCFGCVSACACMSVCLNAPSNEILKYFPRVSPENREMNIECQMQALKLIWQTGGRAVEPAFRIHFGCSCCCRCDCGRSIDWRNSILPDINFAIFFHFSVSLCARRKSKRSQNMRPQKRNLHWMNVIK